MSKRLCFSKVVVLFLFTFVLLLILSSNLRVEAENSRSDGRSTGSTASYKWYLAEGSTAWGFDTYISIENPNDEGVICTITLMESDGSVTAPTISLPATSQTTINPRSYLGESDFSTKVECRDRKIIAVDRSMYWTPPGTAVREGHSSIGSNTPASTWYMAEGSSSWGFETWILIQNPNGYSVTCDITYMIEGDGPQSFQKVVNANSRATFAMVDDIGAKDASIRVSCTSTIMCERAMYRNNRRCGHDSIGTTSPSMDFYLPEGTTNYGFTEYILLQNPNSYPVTVDMTYMTSYGPEPKPSFIMDPLTRKTIRVNDDIQYTDLSTKVHATGSIIAERAMYWDNGTGEAGHASIGLSSGGMIFYLPDGQSSDGFETFTCVQNPNDDYVEVKVTYMTPSGQGNMSFTDLILSQSRATYNMTDRLTNSRAAIKVESLRVGMPIMCERAMYCNGRSGGTDTIGLVDDRTGGPGYGITVVEDVDRDVYSSAYVYGVLRNDTVQPVNLVNIAGTLYDSSGNVVASSTGYSDISVLDPGDTATFRLLFHEAPAYASYQLQTEYDISGEDRNRDVEVTSHQGHVDGIDYYHVTGNVKNTGSSAHKFVKVCVAFYNSSGSLLSTSIGYVALDTLNPGQSSSFDVSINDKEGSLDVDSYTIQVSCQN